ncbi:MAG: sarcosine oxidase subunit delta [Sneathiellaceae bacterium]
MFLIDCPWCGTRPQSEFAAHGEAQVVRPADPAAASDAEWAAYLFLRDNPKGRLLERWVHRHGCRRWFTVARDTATDRIEAVYPPAGGPAGPPSGPAGGDR